MKNHMNNNNLYYYSNQYCYFQFRKYGCRRRVEGDVDKEKMDKMEALLMDATKTRRNLMPCLCQLVYLFWDRDRRHYPLLDKPKVEEIRDSLLKGAYRFSVMHRSFIPKPNKPGKLRPITQPHKIDLVVMDALSLLLSRVCF